MARLRTCCTLALGAALFFGCLAALCGCAKFRRPPKISEPSPRQRRGWADLQRLATVHPMWDEVQPLLGEEQPPPAPLQTPAPPAQPSVAAIVPDEPLPFDVPSWRAAVRQRLARAGQGLERYRRAALERKRAEIRAEAKSRRAALEREIAQAKRQREEELRRLHDKLVAQSMGERMAIELPALAAPDSRASPFAPARRAPRRTLPPEARKKLYYIDQRIEAQLAREERAAAARLRLQWARKMSALSAWEAEELARAQLLAEQRQRIEEHELASQEQRAEAFMQRALDQPPQPVKLDMTAAAQTRWAALAEAASARGQFAQAKARELQAIDDARRQLREKILDDVRRTALTVAAAHGIELSFEPGEGEDLTELVAQLLAEHYLRSKREQGESDRAHGKANRPARGRQTQRP